jgi:hypothetical protein
MGVWAAYGLLDVVGVKREPVGALGGRPRLAGHGKHLFLITKYLLLRRA